MRRNQGFSYLRRSHWRQAPDRCGFTAMGGAGKLIGIRGAAALGLWDAGLRPGESVAVEAGATASQRMSGMAQRPLSAGFEDEPVGVYRCTLAAHERMDEQRLTVQMIGPDGGDVRLDDFLEFLFDLRTVLRATDRAIAHTDEPTTAYTIGDLSHSSPATVVLGAQPREPGLDLRERVLSAFVGGITQIQAGVMPRGFSTNLLLEYQELAEHLDGHLREASFSHAGVRVQVSASFKSKIEQIIGPDRREHGAVSGTVDIVNAHQRRLFFWLYPPGAGERIKCYFGQKLVQDVGLAIRRHVTVTGVLQFKATMLQPHTVLVAGIDVHEPDDDLPSVAHLRGLAKEVTGDEPTDDFVRRLRDGW